MGQVWDRTTEFLSDNSAAILPIALITFFVPASIESSVSAALDGANMNTVLLMRAIQVGCGIISLWGTLAIVAMALGLAARGDTQAIATRRLPGALLVHVLLFVGLLLLALPVPVALVAGGVDVTALARGDMMLELPLGVSAFVALYALFAGVFVLWLTARLVVVTSVIVAEEKSLGALAKSWRLTRGSVLSIMGVILLFLLVSWVAGLAANMVFGSVFELAAGGGDDDGISLAGVLTSIVVAAVQSAFMVLTPAFTAKLYQALAARHGMGMAIPL